MKTRTRALLAAVAVTASLLALPAAPAGAAVDPITGFEVVATGLQNPRGVLVAPDGTVLVAEAGANGVYPCLPPSPGTQYKPACLSQTGGITAVRNGQQLRVVSDLPSVGPPDGSASSGPHDLTLATNGLLVTMGYANNPDRRADLGPGGALLGNVVRLSWDGSRHSIADLTALEGALNPDGLPGTEGEWSNPYALAYDGKDKLVVDAGANDVVRVAPNGAMTVEVVFPNRLAPAPPNFPPGTQLPMQPVPTSIVQGPDGAFYIGELTGFPYPRGGARVYRYVPGSAPTIFAEGFSTIMDLAFDAGGRLHVLEMFRNGLLSGDPMGAIRRVEADGTTTTVASNGLLMPTSLAFAADGSIYVTSKSIIPASGELLRIPPA